jgi:chromosome segregation ATPase
MLKNTLIIALIILAIYLYYQNRKLKGLPTTDTSSRTIYEVGEKEGVYSELSQDHEDLIAEKDAALRSKNEAEQEALALNNRLKNKQQEVSRKEQEIERLKKEKSQSEIALNKKLTELKEKSTSLENELSATKQKYSKQGQLLDTEQLECKKLEEKIEQLESQITELTRSKSPMPGEFPPEDELIKEHQAQLRKINTLFDEQAKDCSKIDFNGLYSLLETIANEQKKKKQIEPIFSRKRKEKKNTP